jgi:FKBP-type peptidyl-prolyl cis-trans isomerase
MLRLSFKWAMPPVFLIFIIAIIFSACKMDEQGKSIKIVPFDVKNLDTLITASGLKYIMVKKNPSGLSPTLGKEVKVHYTGFFSNGKVFDSSLQRNEPLTFTLGIGQVIKGWDEGIALLHVGERARLIVPYNLGYGIDGMGPVPPMSTLIFDVELISVQK